jgi:hypothetical protein
LKYPLHAADVELQIIRAAHEGQQGAPSAILAWLRLRVSGVTNCASGAFGAVPLTGYAVLNQFAARHVSKGVKRGTPNPQAL